MRQSFMHIYRDQFDLSADSHILLALSGGVDSMVLFDLLRHLPDSLRPSLTLAHVNHHLRKEADQECRELRSYVEGLGYPLYVKDWQPSDHPEAGIEAAGRAVRYEFFASLVEDLNCEVVMTAHHKSDQAETVLMRLVRGGFWQTLQGIQAQQDFHGGQLLRPLLQFSKDDLYAYAQQENLLYFEDASNAENDYSRNRYRNLILPLLKEENPRVEDQLAQLAQQMQDLDKISEDWVKTHLQNCVKKGQLQRDLFLKQPAYGQFMILRHFILQRVEDPSYQLPYQLLKDVSAWVQTGRNHSYQELGAGYYLLREYNDLKLVNHRPQVKIDPSSAEFRLSLNHWVSLSAYERIACFEGWPSGQMQETDQWVAVDAQKMAPPFKINHRQAGDRMTLKGPSCHSKKIKDIMIDQKIPLKDREEVWLVRDKYDNIIWLITLKESYWSEDYQPGKNQYIIVYRNEKGQYNDNA